MKRLLALLVLVVAAGLVAGACNADPDAADVNGTTINQATLNADLAAIESSPDQACFLQITNGLTQLVGTSLVGVSSGTYSTAFASAFLDMQVRAVLFAQFAKSRGFPITSSALATARTDVGLIESEGITDAATSESEGGAPSSCTATSADGASANVTPAQLQSMLSPSLVDQVVYQEAALETALTSVGGKSTDPSAVAAYYRANESDFDNICVTILGSSTQAEAAQFRTQAEAGTSLAAIAAANPSDTGVETPPCYNVLADSAGFQNVQQTLSGVPVGGLTQPLSEQTQTGTAWLDVRVDSVTPLPLAKVSSFVRNELLNAPANQSRFESAVEAFAKSAVISVDPRDGTWDTGVGGLFPPTAPPSKDLLSPDADQSGPASSSLNASGLPAGSGG